MASALFDVAQYTPRRRKLVDYLSSEILPTLVPALSHLSSAAERSAPDLASATSSKDEPFDQQSMPLRVYLARNVAPTLNKGLELTYREDPSDPIDFLAQFLFQRSGNEAPVADNGEEDEDPLNPLHWLAQYLMRHNPKHAGGSAAAAMPPGPASPRLFIPLEPTKKRDARAPTPERRASPRTYPPALEPTYATVASGEMLCKVDRKIALGLEETFASITATRDPKRRVVSFVCTELETGNKYERQLDEAQIQAQLASPDQWAVGVAAAAQELVKRAILVSSAPAGPGRKSALTLSFEGTIEAAEGVCLLSRSMRLAGETFLVHVVKEAAPASSGLQDDEELGEACALRFRAYEPEASSHLEAVVYQHLAWEPPKRKKQVLNILSRLTVMDLPKGAPARRVALLLLNEGDQAALLSNDNNVTTVQLTMGLTSSDCGPASKGTMMTAIFARAEGASSATEPAMLMLPLEALAGPLPPLGEHDASRPVSLGIEPLAQLTTDLRYNDGKLEHTSLAAAPSVVSSRLEEARTFDATIAALLDASPEYQEDKVTKRDLLWRQRRDQTFQDRRTLREADAEGTVVFRQGQLINGTYMVVSMAVVTECINGILRFNAYDPSTSASFELRVEHFDTRSFPPAPGGVKQMLNHDAAKLAQRLCKNLKLEKTDKGRGRLALHLWEPDPIHTKMRRAFEILDRDDRGRASRDDVLRLLRTTREDLLHFLHQKESQHFKVPSLPFATSATAVAGSDYLARVLQTVEADARPRVTFAEFSAMLELVEKGEEDP